MTDEETKILIKFLISLGIGVIISLIGGLPCIINKKKISKPSNFYMSVNMLLSGVMGVPCFLFSLSFFWLEARGVTIMNKNTFSFIVWIWLSIIMFVVGLHGILNKKKIDNPKFYLFCESFFYGSMIGFIGLILWVWLWGWPWHPHILFEWQKNPQAILNKPLF